MGRPGAQRQRRVPHRVRPEVRGGSADRVGERHSGAAGRQRVLRHGGGGAAAAALRPLPGSQPAQPAPRRFVAVARDPRRRGDHDRQPRRRRRLEVVRQPGSDRSAVVPDRRASLADRRGWGRRERLGSVHRRPRWTARHQRGRAIGGVRVGGVPDVAWCAQPHRRRATGHDRTGSRAAARVERRSPVVPPDADRRSVGAVRPAQPGRPADRTR